MVHSGRQLPHVMTTRESLPARSPRHLTISGCPPASREVCPRSLLTNANVLRGSACPPSKNVRFKLATDYQEEIMTQTADQTIRPHVKPSSAKWSTRPEPPTTRYWSRLLKPSTPGAGWAGTSMAADEHLERVPASADRATWSSASSLRPRGSWHERFPPGIAASNLHPSTEDVVVDGGVRVSGHEMFTTNAPAADLFLVTSRTPDQQLLITFIRRDTEGLEVRDSWDSMGMRASASGELLLDGCFVPTAMTMPAGPWGRWDAPFLALALPPPCPCWVRSSASPRPPGRRRSRWSPPGAKHPAAGCSPSATPCND
jgi:hypothetical protein